MSRYATLRVMPYLFARATGTECLWAVVDGAGAVLCVCATEADALGLIA